MRNYSAEPAKSRLNSLKPTAKDDIIVSGALDPYSGRAQAHNARYYASVRKMSTDCERIAKHTGLPIDLVKKAKNHLFMTKHKLEYSDEPEYFYPDSYIAQSWQRLSDKNMKLKPHDIVLIYHEALESDYMAKGYSQKEAHKLANKKYSYQDALDLYLEGENNS